MGNIETYRGIQWKELEKGSKGSDDHYSSHYRHSYSSEFTQRRNAVVCSTPSVSFFASPSPTVSRCSRAGFRFDKVSNSNARDAVRAPKLASARELELAKASALPAGSGSSRPSCCGSGWCRTTPTWRRSGRASLAMVPSERKKLTISTAKHVSGEKVNMVLDTPVCWLLRSADASGPRPRPEMTRTRGSKLLSAFVYTINTSVTT